MGNKCCVSSLRVILWPPPGLPTNYCARPSYYSPFFSIKNSTANKAVFRVQTLNFSCFPSDFAIACRIDFDTNFLFQSLILFYHSDLCNCGCTLHKNLPIKLLLLFSAILICAKKQSFVKMSLIQQII